MGERYTPTEDWEKKYADKDENTDDVPNIIVDTKYLSNPPEKNTTETPSVIVDEKYLSDPPEEKNEIKPKRGSMSSLKRVLLGGAAALSVAIGAVSSHKVVEMAEETKMAEIHKKNKKDEGPRTRKHKTNDLKGRAFADLYNYYTGIEGRAGETEKIDFQKQLHLMWQKKIEITNNDPTVKELAKNLEEEYKEKNNNPITFKQYEEKIKRSINELKLNWNKVAEIKKIDDEQKNIVENIGKSISSKELLAYSFTELMPSTDGKFNKNVMDFLLRNGGERYVSSIPSLHDDKASFGPYQFTEFALYETPKEKRGASFLNKAVDGKKIPDNVAKLRGEDHHRAAYLFAINNIADLVKNLNKEELETLNKKWIEKKDELLQFIATAHHAPVHAIKSAKQWIAEDMFYPYTNYTNERLTEYAKKTESNLKNLQNESDQENSRKITSPKK